MRLWHLWLLCKYELLGQENQAGHGIEGVLETLESTWSADIGLLLRFFAKSTNYITLETVGGCGIFG